MNREGEKGAKIDAALHEHAPSAATLFTLTSDALLHDGSGEDRMRTEAMKLSVNEIGPRNQAN